MISDPHPLIPTNVCIRPARLITNDVNAVMATHLRDGDPDRVVVVPGGTTNLSNAQRLAFLQHVQNGTMIRSHWGTRPHCPLLVTLLDRATYDGNGDGLTGFDCDILGHGYDPSCPRALW